MADRATLALNKLDAFGEWLEARGWKRVQTKGEYEVLRATKPGERPLIVYARMGAKMHASVQGYSGRDHGLVRRFIRDSRKDRDRG